MVCVLVDVIVSFHDEGEVAEYLLICYLRGDNTTTATTGRRGGRGTKRAKEKRKRRTAKEGEDLTGNLNSRKRHFNT